MPDTHTGKTVSLEIAGERAELYAARAVYLPVRRTLLIADPHFGKDLFFRRKGFPVPAGTSESNLERLSALFAITRAERLIILGDFLHAREGISQELLFSLSQWRKSYASIEMLLIAGNHDRHAGDVSAETGIVALPLPFAEAPFVFAHEPGPSTEGYVFAGHVHPCVRLQAPDGDKARLACFWFGKACAVLPSFGTFTGSHEIRPAAEDRVFVIAGGDVHETGV